MMEQAFEADAHSTPTILVVDSQPTNRRLVSDALRRAGYAPLCADCGASALNVIEAQAVDAVILNAQLPDMDGRQLCQRARERGLTTTPIVLLASQPDPEQVATDLRQCADDYVAIPFATHELLARLQRLLQRQHMLQRLEHENHHLRQHLDHAQRELHTTRLALQSEALQRRELIHNVATHLQSLSQIIDAELRRLPPGPEREPLQRIRSRARSVALVYQISEALQHDPVRIDEVIRSIASALKTIYRPWKRVTLTIKGEATELPVALASPLAMVLNELLTNSFKHAFPDQRFGAITVRFHQEGTHFWLEVADNGVGAMSGEQSFRMGCHTARQLIASLDGTIEWHSTPDGTRVHVRVPLPTTLPPTTTGEAASVA
ncbi:sensor histidine kinase [Kallotenue papyrolyticum]|uniref:sensor histidine kinase n=1 Tax=Kallotenue papyrolyticum TaxID=1325125 RepID=UPI00047859B4|nr:response regulator [Kallotenue papyrolyticum]